MIGLRLKQISKRFVAPDGGAIIALEDLSVEIAPGQFVVVVGPNGSGKSTLLNLVAGQEHPDLGTVTANIEGRDRDWTHVSSRRRSRYVARIHQDPAAGTAGDLTVSEHLRLGELSRVPIPFLTAVPSRSRKTMGDRLSSALSTKVDANVSELSHGQRQLLALEMAAARSAQILLLDEPTASLDRDNAAFCMRRTRELQTQLHTTILLVTHDMAIAAQFGDRLLVLRDGRLQADMAGVEKAALKPEDVFHLCRFDVPAVASYAAS